MEKKYKFIISCFIILFIIILGRIFYLQTFDRKFLVDKATNQRTTPIPIQAERGDIKTNDGSIIATSMPVFNVYSDSRYITDKEETAKILADFFKLNKTDVLTRINSGFYSVIVKGISKSKIDEFKKIKPRGINYYKTNMRIYPNNEEFSNVLGFVGTDGAGLSGVELSLNKYLQGTDGVNYSEKDRNGNIIEYDNQNIKPAVDGDNVTLTIDSNIEYQMTKAIEAAVKEFKARKGVAISINPTNGSIYGIAEFPNYNPNNYKDYSKELYKSSAVSMTYEPGSTFKPITVSIADSLGLINYNTDKFLDNNAFRVGKYTIHAWNGRGFGYQTVEEVLKNSSNAGAAQIGLRIPADKFQNYLTELGFGHKTGIEISGEGNSIMQSESAFKTQIARATTSFGQGIAVTPIQLMNAWSTVINGGYKIQPHILKNVIAPNNEIIYSDSSKCLKGAQIFPTETSERVKKMLQAVVDDGTGKKAQITGYTVGGKTGTAQIAENGVYISGRNIVSFMGFAPVENPQIMTLVILDSPADSRSVGGGLMCAPTVKAILEYSLNKLGIKPNVVSNKNKENKKDSKSIQQINLNIGNYMYRTKSYVINNKPSIPYEFSGNGNIVVQQNYVSKNGKTSVVFVMDNIINDSYVLMPNLVGIKSDEIMQLFGAYSKNIVINGDKNQPITMQDIESGQRIDVKNEKLIFWTK